MKLARIMTATFDNARVNVVEYAAEDWSSTINYQAGYHVRYNGVVYRVLDPKEGARSDYQLTLGMQPDEHPDLYVAVPDAFADEYRTGMVYGIGDLVHYQAPFTAGSGGAPSPGRSPERGLFRSRLAGNVNHTPNRYADSTYWEYLQPVYYGWQYNLAYSINDCVIWKHHVFKSVKSQNVGVFPDRDPQAWVDMGATLAWSAFDQRTSTQTIASDMLVFDLQATGFLDTLALLNIDAASLNLKIFEGATLVLDQDCSLSDESSVTDYWEYFTEPIRRKNDVIIESLPNAVNPRIVVTLQSPGGIVRVGHLGVGQSIFLGETLYPASLNNVNYTRFVEDEFGNTIIVPRGANKSGRFKVRVENNDVDRVYNAMSDYQDESVLIIGASVYAASIFFGTLREWNINLNSYGQTELDVEVKGF